jgi:hypothetical protein
MMNSAPPLICANVAAVNNETASVYQWYGYFENGASSLSARCTMRGRFYVFAKHNQKICQLNQQCIPTSARL